MNLEYITTFLTVYRSGSFQKAAEALFLPQPTVSHRIQQLESMLGKSLIIRRKSGNQLTLEGKAFLPYAIQMLEVMERGKIAVERASKQEEVQLEIGCTNSLSNFLYGMISGFIERFPQTKIKVHSFSTNEVIRSIRIGTFNLGVSRYAIEDTELTFKLINSEHIDFIVSHTHPLAKAKSVTLQDISNYPLIVYQEGKQYRETIAFVFESNHLNYRVKYEMHNLQLIKQMVADNLGVTLFAPSYMEREVSSGQLVAIPIQDNPFPMRQTFLVYHQEKLNAVDQLFYDFILSTLAQEH